MCDVGKPKLWITLKFYKGTSCTGNDEISDNVLCNHDFVLMKHEQRSMFKINTTKQTDEIEKDIASERSKPE
jgi:hypothetical protein